MTHFAGDKKRVINVEGGYQLDADELRNGGEFFLGELPCKLGLYFSQC